MQAVLAGAIAGGTHAVTGPDHLAALLPMTMGDLFSIHPKFLTNLLRQTLVCRSYG